MEAPASSSKSIIAQFSAWLQDRQKQKKIIDDVVKAVEPGIKNVRGYRKRLQKPIQTCLEHCKTMVRAVPGPIYLNHADYHAAPLIRAAFIGSEKIEDLLRHQDPTLTSEASAGQDLFALLTMTHRETREFGSKQEANMVIADASLKSVTFSDHKLVVLSTTLESSRDKLEKICFAMILEGISKELAARRTDLAELREHRERLQAMSELFSGGESGGRYFGHDTSPDYEKLEKVELMLKENAEELRDAQEGVETPEDWLERLAELLIVPEKVLNFNTVTIRLDWRNVITEATDETASNVTFAQCSIAEEAVRDAVLLSYTVQK